MTDPTMHLRSRWERPPTPIFLRDMISFAAERLMEVGGLTGAPYGEKSPSLLVQRNGPHERVEPQCSACLSQRSTAARRSFYYLNPAARALPRSGLVPPPIMPIGVC